MLTTTPEIEARTKLAWSAIDVLDAASVDEKAALRFADWGDFDITEENAPALVAYRLAVLHLEDFDNEHLGPTYPPNYENDRAALVEALVAAEIKAGISDEADFQ